MLNSIFINKCRRRDLRVANGKIKAINSYKFNMVFIALAASGCASITPLSASPSGQTVNSETVFVESFPDLDIKTFAQSSKQDVFRVGDIADIAVYKVEDLSGTYTVDRNGVIDFPLIGDVDVSGMNTADLQGQLETLYGETYLQDPSVSVKIEKTKLGKLVVDGAVEKPGVFEVFEIVTLSEAIALAGGVTLEAKKDSVYVARLVDGESKVQVVDLNKIQKYGENNPSIYPGDIIYIQNSSVRLAYNEFVRTIPLLSAVLFATTR